MPRFVVGKTKVPTTVKRERAATYRVSGYGQWTDPFPVGFGTEPEKRVYEALSRRGIPFYYLNDVQVSIPEIEFMQWFQADFVLPDQRIIIEVQGAHWHSMPQTIEADALKFAYYQYMGWRPLAWWDFDILANVNKLFELDPQLSQYGYVGDVATELAAQRRTKTDSSQGIRTLNYNRGQRNLYKKKAVAIKTKKVKGVNSYATR